MGFLIINYRENESFPEIDCSCFQSSGFGFKLLWFCFVLRFFLICGAFMGNKLSSDRKTKAGRRYFLGDGSFSESRFFEGFMVVLSMLGFSRMGLF